MLAASADGEYLALALSGTGAEQVIWLDGEGKQSARAEVPGTIKSMDCRAGNLAVLTEKQLILFDRAGGTLGQAEVELDARKAVLAADGSCMLFGMNRLYVYH